MRKEVWVLGIVFIATAFVQAHADAALLLEEPFGRFGAFSPTGHAAIYLTRVCADSPTRLRRCKEGEAGVVISRYHKISGYDWLAIPLVPYLYAVDNPQDIPDSANPQSVAALRDAYRRAHLMAIAPDNAEGQAPDGNWVQLVGSSYDRKIYGFRIETTPEQDDALIERFNTRRNTSHFNFLFRNCADFSSKILNFYYPHSVGRNLLADAGLTTPKHLARSLVAYSRRHHDLASSSFVIPQVPGSMHRSEHVDGVLEAVLKTKKYVLPLAILHPIITGTLVAAYLYDGRFNPSRNATVFDVAHEFQPHAAGAATAVKSNSFKNDGGAQLSGFALFSWRNGLVNQQDGDSVTNWINAAALGAL
jgi:hypothetical protein